MNDLKKEGFYAFRMAGSHSPIDVIALDLNMIRLIQVKSVKVANANTWTSEVRKISEMMVPMNCRKELWMWVQPWRKWKKIIIDGADEA